MAAAITRTDKWKLAPTLEQVELFTKTVNMYRAYVRALIGVIHANYLAIISADSQCAAVEKLIHQTAKNPSPRYPYFNRKFPMFPSYLRRAAIENALGQVSSFLTRYHKWQSGQRRKRTDESPRLTSLTGVYPVLYKGQCIKFDDGLEVAEIKVFDGKTWDWIKVKIIAKRNRHNVIGNRQRSPQLIVKSGQAHLSVPFTFNPPKLPATAKKACAVDLGINTGQQPVLSVLMVL